MAKKKYYLTLDTETATLPFADQLCHNAREKQTMAIAKPLIYDIGWVITDRKGEVVKKENFLIQETFFVPNIFNTAYYKEKRPLYMELLEQKQIKSILWNDMIDILLYDLRNCDIVTAYNACFDFKKAIPFTERYIKALYSPGYNMWEEEQKRKCKKLLKKVESPKNPEYLKPVFKLRDEEFPLVDLWGLACKKLVNNKRYKDFCFENRLFTKSALYFKTSAESSFQYLTKDADFIEDHTALSDALIEAQILTKALKKGKVEPSIEAFPFRELGTTIDFAFKKKKYRDILLEVLDAYIKENKDFWSDRYYNRIIDMRIKLL